ncbi:hypothetical protein V865_006855 [Kwoniella europaea PYCC6329]|uniref:BTB domain-containing protein n=1 Tax=Kwoniella europaea PYCC6329 TaxID=1423913 RepID=A0AAX4KR23_9TREE
MEQPSKVESDLDFDPTYSDRGADFTLFSSDSVAFKVHKYYLQAHSTVFRDMISNCDLKENHNLLEFTDPQIEHSTTLTIFLNLVYNRQLNLSRDSLGPFRNLIGFAKKYDCRMVLPTLKSLARQFLDQYISPHYVFIIAAELDDIDLASDCIIKGTSWVWPKDSDRPDPPQWRTSDEVAESERESKGESNLGISRGAGVLEVTSGPIWELPRVPISYLVGLMKTGRMYMLTARGGDGVQASQDFKKIMKACQGK